MEYLFYGCKLLKSINGISYLVTKMLKKLIISFMVVYL